jgi:sugar phosphate isomerase/epimerase
MKLAVMELDRRDFLRAAAAAGVSAGAVAWPSAMGARSASALPRTGMGICVYALGNRIRAKLPGGPPLEQPLAFLDHCACLGAGGVQVPLRLQGPDDADRLRKRAEDLDMYVEGIVKLPESAAEAEKLDAELELAARAGAAVVRTVLVPGRRYEEYPTAAAFREAVAKGVAALERAAAIAERRKVRIALENHKCHRVDERLDLLRRLGSEQVGVCLDVGNSFALLEDPLEVARAYAPLAYSVHIKDLLVRGTPEGFIIADAALGEGFLDLPEIVKVIRAAKPEVRFSLESITRGSIAVPCLGEGYWATFGEIPARDLARTLRVVREREARDFPPKEMPEAELLRREEETVKRSVAYARDRLGI